MSVPVADIKEGAGYSQGHQPIQAQGENSPPESDLDEMHLRSLTLNPTWILRNMAVTHGLWPFHDADLLLRPRVGAQWRAIRVEPQIAEIGAWEKNV